MKILFAVILPIHLLYAQDSLAIVAFRELSALALFGVFLYIAVRIYTTLKRRDEADNV